MFHDKAPLISLTRESLWVFVYPDAVAAMIGLPE